jgi:hypothetical protein
LQAKPLVFYDKYVNWNHIYRAFCLSYKKMCTLNLNPKLSELKEELHKAMP